MEPNSFPIATDKIKNFIYITVQAVSFGIVLADFRLWICSNTKICFVICFRKIPEAETSGIKILLIFFVNVRLTFGELWCSTSCFETVFCLTTRSLSLFFGVFSGFANFFTPWFTPNQGPIPSLITRVVSVRMLHSQQRTTPLVYYTSLLRICPL